MKKYFEKENFGFIQSPESWKEGEGTSPFAPSDEK